MRSAYPNWLPLLAIPAAYLACAGAARAATLHIRSVSQVAADQFTLADLLSGPLEPGVQSQARATVLGLAPLPGVRRTWSRTQMSDVLSQSGWPSAQFDIPERIELTRTAYPVRRDYVVAAIGQYLDSHPAWKSLALDPRTLLYSAPLTTVSGDPGVTIATSRVDQARRRLELSCVAHNDPALLAFTVSLDLPKFVRTFPTSGAEAVAPIVPRHQDAAEGEATISAAAGAATNNAPILVRPGRIAELHIQSTGYDLTARVMPLAVGREGERIRVENIATKTVITVEVVAQNQVRDVPTEASHVHW